MLTNFRDAEDTKQRCLHSQAVAMRLSVKDIPATNAEYRGTRPYNTDILILIKTNPQQARIYEGIIKNYCLIWCLYCHIYDVLYFYDDVGWSLCILLLTQMTKCANYSIIKLCIY